MDEYKGRVILCLLIGTGMVVLPSFLGAFENEDPLRYAEASQMGYGVTLQCDIPTQCIPLGGTALYCITVKNTGASSDTINLSVPWPPPPCGWGYRLDIYSVFLHPGESIDIALSVEDQLPDMHSPGDTFRVPVTGISQGDPTKHDQVVTFTTIMGPLTSWLTFDLGHWNQYVTSLTEFTIWAGHEGCTGEFGYVVHYKISGPPGSKYNMDGIYHDCDDMWHTGSHGVPVAWQFRDETTSAPRGAYRVEFWSEDDLGNSEPDSHIEWFWMDTSPPVTSLTFLGPSYEEGIKWIADATQIVFEASDNGESGVQLTKYQIDGGVEKKYRGPFSIKEEGYHFIGYYSKDWLNRTEQKKYGTVVVDATPPVTSLSLPDVSCILDDVTWVISSSDLVLSSRDTGCGLDTIQYSINSDFWRDFDAPFTLDDGIYDIGYYGKDHLGNTEQVSHVVVGVDTQTPCLIFTSPHKDSLYIAGREIMTLPLPGTIDSVIFGPMGLTGKALDHGAGIKKIEVFMDGELIYICHNDTLDWWLHDRAFGLHTFDICACDYLGHTSTRQLSAWICNL